MKALAAFALILIPHATAPVRAALREVEIVGLDYAFKVPAQLAAGRTAFRFRNDGKVDHELNIVLLKRGVSTQAFIAASDAGKPLAPMMDGPVGVLFAHPNASSPAALVANLQPGRSYAVFCIFRDSTSKPRHQTMGMFATLNVSPGAAPRGEALVIDTVVAMDYAFRLPPVLSPGRHHFAFVNTGKQRHEISVARLKQGVTMATYAKVSAADGDVGALLDADFGVLHAVGGTSPLGLLQIDMLPGREYLVECNFQDDPKAKPHNMLGMYGSIAVRSTGRQRK